MPMKRRLIVTVLVATAVLIGLSSCTTEHSEKTIINLSFTPWIGFYPFHFAIEKRIPDKYGVQLRVLETLSVQDFRRVNIKEHVDAFACSLMELTRTNDILEEQVEIISFLDYSNGADVIIADKSIASIRELEGKVVGFDWRSLGHYFFILALQHEGLDEKNYTHRQVERVVAADNLASQTLDAYITYPPISNQLLSNQDLHVIFDSEKIPFQIMDVLAMKKGNIIKKLALRNIWNEVTSYIEQNPEEYHDFVANQMGGDVKLAEQELSRIVMINADMQANVSYDDIQKLAISGCGILGTESAMCLDDLKKLYFNNTPIVVDDAQ